MKRRAILLWLITILGLTLISTTLYKKVFRKQVTLPFVTQKPERRTIAKSIEATGKISISEKIKIGSLVTGIIKKLHTNENESVKKGQLLAEIDTGKDDADVRQARGALQKTGASLTYQKQYFLRQKSLYETNQLARDEFEQVSRDYTKAQADYIIAKASYDKTKQEFDNTKIYAPQDGIVINVGVSEGERVTTDLDATVLFEIAKDITKMEATLEIDESDVGLVKAGQTVSFTIDTFPSKIFRTKIEQISYSPKKKNGNIFYKAIVRVDNSELSLRPGLSINAKISIAKSKNALVLPSQAFMISHSVLREIAKSINYSFLRTDKKAIKKRQKTLGEQIKTVWVAHKNGLAGSFIEKIIKTNITDDIYFEVVSGITEQDEVVIDIEETSHMEAILKKAFRSNF